VVTDDDEEVDDRRESPRFEVEGMTLEYERPKLFTGTDPLSEKDCPVLDMSRGGARFLTNKPLSAGMQLNLRISIPDDSSVAVPRGQVRWAFLNRGVYRHRIGVQFAPFGDEAGCNTAETLAVLEHWESRVAQD